MKTICFFNSTKAWGGGEKWHFETSTFLHEQGHCVLVIAHKHGELFKRLKKTNIKCLGTQISNLSFLNPVKIKAVQKTLQIHRVSTIILNLSRDVKVAGLAAKQAGVERIIYRRGSAIPISNTLLNRYLFKNVISEILANSRLPSVPY